MGLVKIMPAIVIKDVVLMPSMTVNFSVIKKEAAKACVAAMHAEQLVFVSFERIDSKKALKESIYEIGMVARLRQINRLPDKTVQLMVNSLYRGRVVEIMDDACTQFKVELLEQNDPDIDIFEKEAMLRNLRELFLEYSLANPKAPKAIPQKLKESGCLYELIDQIAGNIPLPYIRKIELLQSLDVSERYFKLVKMLNDEIAIAKIREGMKKKTQEKLSKSQRDYYLREQLQAIKRELGDDAESEEDELLLKVSKLDANPSVKAEIEKEIKKLSAMNPGSSESYVERTYIETLLELPWNKESKDTTDISFAKEVLNEDHYGLEKVKERILEFLSVKCFNSKGESPIICLVGPPGTGKTSIAKSIARALNREYVRVCLGGVRDEAEIRGHRRTYVGAMPGNIIDGIKRAGVSNPLMLLDEIDKTSGDYKGATSSALLEVLDSQQNSRFKDHYIGIPVDLSNVMFIATANDENEIPRPLYDRMEIIEISSYTANEKFHIAKEFLLKKQYENHGLNKKQISINDAALKKIILNYTREAGVRELERTIGKLMRKGAMRLLEEKASKVNVTVSNLEEFLGKEKYHEDGKNRKDEVGIVRGLAWTSVGGTTLSIEVNVMPGKGELELTGQLGDVMKESALAGISFIRSIAAGHGIEASFFNDNDLHIHIPEGAVPKDGPSAGISMATAVFSAITGKPVRRDVAMTGEITLRGSVLAIGGLKEKILAAKTAGIYTVLVPKENESDVNEISDEIKEKMNIIFVSNMNEVLDIALVK